jgi:hypothetical protein
MSRKIPFPLVGRRRTIAGMGDKQKRTPVSVWVFAEIGLAVLVAGIAAAFVPPAI